MVRAYKVRFAFSAPQLRDGSLRIEFFEAGTFLVVLGTDDGYATFCHRDHDEVLDRRARFTISEERFAFLTEPP